MRRPIRQYWPDYRYLLTITVVVVFFDQLTKMLVRMNITFTDYWAPWDWLAPYARIVHWKNTGAAFGIFQNGSLVFTILGILVTLAILNFFPLIPRSDRWLRAALAFEMAGALGNLIDRLAQGWVTDFISILRFPVFNIADASITFGVTLIILPLLPHLRAELEDGRLFKLARSINLRRRSSPRDAPKPQETYSLGLIEALFAENPAIQRFTVNQDLLRIRQRVLARRKGSSRG